jgi:hypothetical protein
MAVTLVVEDGTGRSDANALISLADFKSYHDGRGSSYSGFTDDVLNAAIVRASAFMLNAYVWDGLKVKGRAQTMPFPRYALVDRDNWPVPPTEIPREIKSACAEIALYEATNPGGMNPTVVQSDKVRSEQVGAIRIEYANLFNNVSDSRPILMIVADMIWPFLATGQGNALSGISQRV